MLRKHLFQLSMGFPTRILSLFIPPFRGSTVYPSNLILKFNKPLMIGRNGHPLLKDLGEVVYPSRGDMNWILASKNPCTLSILLHAPDLAPRINTNYFCGSVMKEKTRYHTNMDGGAYQIPQRKLPKKLFSI